MKKNISVIDINDVKKNNTYIKRANQLVKKKRAIWIDDDTIKLLQPLEGASMELLEVAESTFVNENLQRVQEAQYIEQTTQNKDSKVNLEPLVKELNKFKLKFYMEVLKNKIFTERRFFTSAFDGLIFGLILLLYLWRGILLFLFIPYFVYKIIICIHNYKRNFPKHSGKKFFNYFESGDIAELDTEVTTVEAENNF